VKKAVTNIAVSVRNRLINLAKVSERDYNTILRFYFQERFLYRLSISAYKQKLILKGALLLIMNDISKYRPTKDVDFLGKGIINETDECIDVIKEIASIDCKDGVEFVVEKISAEQIKEGKAYAGVRVHLPYRMDTIKGYFSIDIGFVDIIVEGPYELDYPVMLEFPSPNILVYSMESVVAEKFEAIVKLNLVTSRMKDFFDIVHLAERTDFNKAALKEALITTFRNRGTNIEDRLMIYRDSFKENVQKQIQWTTFLQQNKLTAENNFSEVVTKISEFIEPVFNNDENNNWDSKKWKWN